MSTGNTKCAATSALVLAVMVALTSGCRSEPFCLNCTDGAASSMTDAAVFDVSPVDVVRDTVTVDAQPDRVVPDGCTVGADELCNGVDDNCDGTIDEGFDLGSDPRNCGTCGNLCNRPHAFPACSMGACVVRACDTGWHDLDRNPDNGCEYACTPVPGATNDATCDRRDDDCDGTTDEDVDLCHDAQHCGSCSRACNLPHVAASRCAPSSGGGACTEADTRCEIGTCETGFYDIDADPSNGCEYACTPSGPEICDGRDNDCNGVVDEGDPGGGTPCGSAVGACRQGVNHCRMGVLSCEGAIEPGPEICDGIDNDCNGMVDDGSLSSDPRVGAACGSGIGDCRPGTQRCVAGALTCQGAVEPSTEVCDGRDNDCDGTIDDDVPTGGPCGSSVGACRPGTLTCVGGTMRCMGGTGPTAETCNGVDDDCNGAVDDGSLAADPRIGGACGSAVGECRAGTMRCVSGGPACQGAIGPSAEVCDGRDNDCDGTIDDEVPTGGPCGSSVGACRPGTLTCVGGTMRCMGGTGPTVETCNGIDDDCDGTVDNGFDLSRDVGNCGRCGNSCLGRVPNAFMGCSAGTCVILACAPGFVDDPTTPERDCSYACTPTGAEICNGLDDDCDRVVDEGLTPPASFCRSAGACAGTTARCSGAMGWTCPYPSSVEVDSSTGQPVAVETRCDGVDNNCNNAIDESFTNLGTSCATGGTGACNRTGTYVCRADGAGTTCSAEPGSPSAELCDGIDNDCDGVTDETRSAPGPNASFFVDTAWVPLSGTGSSTIWIMQYEASRPGATSMSVGSLTSRACSLSGVLPWTNLTALQAQAACNAIGARLCTESEWQQACQVSASSATMCFWSYDPVSTCRTYSPTTCNGADNDIDALTSGVQNGLLPTGTLTSCDSVLSASARIFDLSGNAREFTQPRSVGVNPMRGGGYNSPPDGMTCQFAFSVADDTFRFPNTGFRCCFTGALPP